ncbi:MAG: Hsp20/alpha crystallin family protein [Desulfovibrio sp.]|nr:Hsp20/alpha crystallin family protein [Desulfovibrio sp.]
MSTQYVLPTLFTRPASVDNLFNNFFDDFPRFWLKGVDKQEQSFLPNMDVTSDPQNYTITADLPGMNKESVSLEINNGVLTLSGEKHLEKKENETEQTCHLQERVFGAFSRSFTLPEDVESEKIAAKFKDGVLTITLPRKTSSEKQQISITAA